MTRELEDPRQERACQLRASGLTCEAAYAEAGYSEGNNNAARFFRQRHVRERVAQIKARRAVLADLDDAWVLRRLKRIGDGNLDDYFERDEDGRRVKIDVGAVSRDEMAVLEEVTVEEFVEGRGEDAERIRRTKLKMESRLKAIELIGRHLNMWPTAAGRGDTNVAIMAQGHNIEISFVAPGGKAA